MVNFTENQIVVISKTKVEATVVCFSNYGAALGDLYYLIENETGYHRMLSAEELELKSL